MEIMVTTWIDTLTIHFLLQLRECLEEGKNLVELISVEGFHELCQFLFRNVFARNMHFVFCCLLYTSDAADEAYDV